MTTGTYTGSYAYVDVTATRATFTSTARVHDTSISHVAVYVKYIATVLNAGTISSSFTDGLAFRFGGAATNESGGHIVGGSEYAAVYLGQLIGGTSTFSNQTNALVQGSLYGVHVGVNYPGESGGQGRITNSGTIEANDVAIYLQFGGSITNQAHALIEATGPVVLPRGGYGAPKGAIYLNAYVNSASTTEIYGNVTNLGTIASTNYGNAIEGDLSLTNSGTGALISGKYSGFQGLTKTIANSGTIYGAGRAGIDLVGAGLITNSTNLSLIRGQYYGVEVFNASATIDNSGEINSFNFTNGSGIYLSTGGFVSNAASGQIISADTGIRVEGAGTVTNYGTIAGLHGTAVSFASPASELGIAPGSLLVGKAIGGGGTLDFLGAYGQYNTVSGLGSGTLTGSAPGTFSGFNTYLVPISSYWALAGGNAINSGQTLAIGGSVPVDAAATLTNNGLIVDRGVLEAFPGATLVNNGTFVLQGLSTLEAETLAGSGTIDITTGGFLSLTGPASGTANFTGAGKMVVGSLAAAGLTVRDFTLGDTIALSGVTFSASNSVAYNAGLHEIVVYDSGHSQLTAIQTANLTIAAGHALALIGPIQTDIVEQACFVAGTQIETPDGPVAVEALTVGQPVTLARGGTAPVQWIGYRTLDGTRHRLPREAWPLRISAGAFGDGLPRRDLLLSADHAVFCDDMLIPVKCLANGTTIARVPVDSVTYFHVELPCHDVMLAEGLAVESYLDTGNRAAFANGGEVIARSPELASQAWEARGCLPLIVSGSRLEAARRRVNA
jgi:collagen type I alpha